MELIERKINCRKLNRYKDSNRISPFTIAIYKFNYNTNKNDRLLLDRLFQSGVRLAEKVNPAAANMSTRNRERIRIINNATAGVLSEYCWKKYINERANSLIVDFTRFNSANSQIDLIVLKNNKLIEVRSSFPRNGIDFAICSRSYEFDILGPYSNKIKPSEIQKDYYVRTLFHIPNNETLIGIAKKNNFEVFLTGGATWDMMNDSEISKDKDLLPDDYVARIQEEKSSYRVVPFSKALDTIEIFNLIVK